MPVVREQKAMGIATLNPSYFLKSEVIAHSPIVFNC
jgi:hypothetical protein